MTDIGPVKFNTGKERIEKARSPYKTPAKDFRKVLAREREEGREGKDDNKVAENDSKKTTRAPKEIAQRNEGGKVSLFDLAKNTQNEKVEPEEAYIAEAAPDLREESFSALIKQMHSKDFKEKGDASLAAASPEVKNVPQFAREQPDLSYINPTAVNTPSASVSSAAQSAKAVEMISMVEQLIDKLYIVEQKGETDTTITLRHPPVFEGVKLVVTSFDSAKGEFNLKFENLTPQGKQVLDMAENQNALKMALDQKGYVVHILTTTTFEEGPVALRGEATAQREKESGKEQKGEQREREEE